MASSSTGIRVTSLNPQPRLAAASFAACDGMSQVSTLSPGLGLGLVVLAVLVGLTGFGLYTAFGPPAQGLTDPFDDHED